MNRTATVLRENILEIMELWQAQVKKDVPAAKEKNSIALFDHLPDIILDISEIMERHAGMVDIDSDTKYSGILVNSVHHGRQRAMMANYTVEQVVHEYIIFHRTLSEFINSHDAYDQKSSDLLGYVIETSILKSVGSFSRSLHEMQEKLIGTLAHDIRNPLSAAKLSLEMMEQDKTGKWAERTRATAQRSVKKAIDLIEGLMNGITVRAGEGMMLDFEESDIVDVIKWVHEEIKEVYTNEIHLDCELKSIRGVFDTTAIRRLLENLIGNAVKYGSFKRPITVSVQDNKDAVEIRVHNYGDPIPEEKQDRIFKFMDSAEKDKKFVSGSWGMGLTLIQMVAEAHGGDINLVSDQQTGTTFIVSLIKHFNEPGKKRAKLAFVVDNI